MCLSGGVWDVRTTWRGTLVSWRGRALLRLWSGLANPFADLCFTCVRFDLSVSALHAARHIH